MRTLITCVLMIGILWAGLYFYEQYEVERNKAVASERDIVALRKTVEELTAKSKPIQRFIPVSGQAITPNFALDTKTGQVCKTWEWVYKDAAKAHDSDLQESPTCLSLYSNY